MDLWRIRNKEIRFSLLKLEDHKKNIEKIIYKRVKDFRPQIIIFDLGKNFLKPSLLGLIKKLKEEKYILIGIDNLKIYYNYLDSVWIPSFFLEKNFKKKNILYGWDKFFLKKNNHIYKMNNKIVILTGAANNNFLPKHMPKVLEMNIPKTFQIIWVQGKYAKKPKINFESNRWKVLKNQKSYESYLFNAGYVLTLYGVSFYESLSCGVPTVCFPIGLNKKKDLKELSEIKKMNISMVEKDYKSAVKKLSILIKDKKKSMLFSKKSKIKLKKNGLENFKIHLKKFF